MSLGLGPEGCNTEHAFKNGLSAAVPGLRQSGGAGASNSQMTAPAGADRFDSVLGPLVRRGYLLAVTMLENREAAEDAVQEASIKAWRKLGDLREAGALDTWYLSIVANQCRSTRRGRWWSVRTVEAPEHGDGFDEDRAVASMDLDRALSRLDPEDRTALFLHYYLDLTFEQVGRVLGLSMTAARSRIYRVLARLRPGLELSEEGEGG